jgi:hypothetical protein
MDKTLQAKLEKLAPKLAAKQPQKASQVWGLFRLFFPLLPGLIKNAVQKSTTKNDERILREVRDILVDADLGENEA